MCKVNIETIEDSKVLWDLVWRMKCERVNCKMTDKEKEIFDKYGITRTKTSLYANGLWFFDFFRFNYRADGHRNQHLHRYRWDKVNLCDMATKVGRYRNRPAVWDYGFYGVLDEHSHNFNALKSAINERKDCKRKLAMADEEYTKDCKRAKENYLRACESALDYYNRQIKRNTEYLADAEEDIKELVERIKNERKTA